MAKYVNSTIELVGNTPLLKADRYAAAAGASDANIFAKLELFNPAGSVKDRIALNMIADAEEKGILKPGATIIEPTSETSKNWVVLASSLVYLLAVWTLWSINIRQTSDLDPRMPILQTVVMTAVRKILPSSIRAYCASFSPMCRLFSVVSRQVCAVLPIMIIGMTAFASAYYAIPLVI